MKTLNCIIIDDEPLAREGIELYVKDVSFLNLLGSFDNAVEANSFLKTNNVDLMFLDIEMPQLTGLDFLKSLNTSPLTILTTAYPQFAIDAFDLNVIDYLLKPIRFERFVQAVNKAQDFKIQEGSVLESVTDNYIFIKSERKYVKIFFSEIEYIKGLKDYVIVYTKENKIITAVNIKTIYSQLPKDIFYRTSKSFIININYIKVIGSDSIQLVTQEIPLGKSYREEFFKNHIDEKVIRRK